VNVGIEAVWFITANRYRLSHRYCISTAAKTMAQKTSQWFRVDWNYAWMYAGIIHLSLIYIIHSNLVVWVTGRTPCLQINLFYLNRTAGNHQGQPGGPVLQLLRLWDQQCVGSLNRWDPLAHRLLESAHNLVWVFKILLRCYLKHRSYLPVRADKRSKKRRILSRSVNVLVQRQDRRLDSNLQHRKCKYWRKSL